MENGENRSAAAGRQNPEVHPLKPFLPAGAKVLMLGSFPPPRARWSMEFYYPNLQNDMWRIMGLVFYGDKDKFLVPGSRNFDSEALADFCTAKGIALSDTAEEVIRLRENASDKFLEVIKPRNIGALLDRLPHCRALVTTGQKATDTLIRVFDCTQPAVGSSSPLLYAGRSLALWRMPSSSRAYPLPLAEKAAVYKKMFGELGML